MLCVCISVAHEYVLLYMCIDIVYACGVMDSGFCLYHIIFSILTLCIKEIISQCIMHSVLLLAVHITLQYS